MRRIAFIPLVVAAAVACSNDEIDPVPLDSDYQIIVPPTAVTVRQDLTVALRTLGMVVVRDGTDTIPGQNAATQLPRLDYFADDPEIAIVDGNGNVRGLKAGTTRVTARGYGTEASFDVTVNAYTATNVILRVLTTPTGPLFTPATRPDSGIMYALPGQQSTSRLEGVVTVALEGGVLDTVYCSYCATKSPARVLRVVRFRSLRPDKATISNQTSPVAQPGSNDTPAGMITALDTSAAYVPFVLEVPSDGLSDTAWVRFNLRPIDSIQIRPDSRPVPADPGDQGTQLEDWPGDSATANVIVTGNENFKARVIMRFRTNAFPNFPGTNPGNTSWTSIGSNARPFLPLVTYESALPDYLAINAGTGNVLFNCEFIGKTGCLAPTRVGAANTQAARDSLVIGCVDNGKRLPGLKTNSTEPVGIPIQFNPPSGLINNMSFYRITGCPLVGGFPGPNIAAPGAYCTSASSTDRLSQCTVWIRARITDPATGIERVYYYRVTARRD